MESHMTSRNEATTWGTDPYKETVAIMQMLATPGSVCGDVYGFILSQFAIHLDEEMILFDIWMKTRRVWDQ